MLTRHRQRLAAGGDHSDTGRGSDDLGDKLGGCFEQVLAVVHHQQELLVLQVRAQQRQRLGRGLVAQVQSRHDGVADQRGVLNLRELDHPCAAREAAREIGRTPNRQAGLADTAWPGEADQAGPGQLPRSSAARGGGR